MNVDVLVPLIATIAYIPLFGVLLSNRPWNRKQRFFFLFLVPAVLWSLASFLGRIDFVSPGSSLTVRIALCITIWMLVQFHYFVSSFYRSEHTRFPLAYVFVIATIVLTALGYIPSRIDVQPGSINVEYGPWLIAIGFAFLATVGLRDIYSLWQRGKTSFDPVERNQLTYLLVAIGLLAVFLVIDLLPQAGDFPVAHVGNLLVACTLTYAVMAHHLLDMSVVFRRALTYLGVYGLGVAIILLVFLLVDLVFDFTADFASLALAIGLAIPTSIFMVYKVYDPLRHKVETAFVGARYRYRQQLSQFITQIHNVSSIEQLGDDFIYLLSQSIDCKRASLLLPEAEEQAFVPRFFYPPAKENPIEQLKLRSDSPITTWLKQEKALLPKRNISIYPEFKSVWQEEREAIRLAGVEAFVPLINMEELVGVMAVGERRDGKPYTVEEFDLLNSIGAQVAASMEKEYIYEQLRQQGKEIAFLNRLSTIVTSSVSIETIFEGFVRELNKMVDFDWVTIALIDGNDLCFLALSSTIGSPWQAEERIPLEGTATERVCQDRKSLYEPDLAQYHRFWTGEHHLQQGIRSIVYLPLTIKDQSIGSLIVGARHPHAFSGKQLKLLEQVALQIATPIENSQLYARAEQRSRIDELTGLFNRRHFEERLKEEIGRHSRYGDVFSIFLLDLDNFKTYNDIYGHPSGDILLNQVGKTIRNSIRNADQAFRYGGDEFVAILPHTAVDDARVVADRVREGIATDMAQKESAITCSIGLACYPSDGVMAGEIVTVADTALYFAKRTGGDRVYVSSKILSEPLEDAGIYARRNGLSAIYALVSTVEAKDPYTYGHSKKVNTYAVALAEAIGLPPEEVSRVSTAALLHDIGKIGVPDKVLNKKGKLNAEDWEAIKSHPKLGATIVGNIPNLAPCVSTILHHHEWWDGTGYPEGLKGEQISIEARILAVADAFEAMSSARPYRPALCGEKVLKELRRGAGSQFDPELVETFIGIVEGGLPEGAEAGTSGSSKPSNSEPPTI
jgi:diguanylate cyclase (GGDEF)-like protein/putative nucleotidyltransferase with HDIG domain